MPKNLLSYIIKLLRNFTLIVSFGFVFSVNAQEYKIDTSEVNTIKKEIKKAQDLVSAKADDSYQEGLDLFNVIEENVLATKDTLLLLDFYKSKIETYLSRFDYDNALNYTNKGFTLLEKYDNKKYLGLYYELLGVINYSLEDNEARDKAFLEAEYYLKRYASKEENIDINFNLAVINKEKKNWNATEKYSLQSLELINTTQKALVRRKYLYTFLAEVYLNKNNLQKADYYLKKIEADVNLSNNRLLLIASYYGLRATYFKKKGMHIEASIFFEKSNEAYNKLSFERTKEIKASLKEKANLQLQELENQKIKSEIELINTNNEYKNVLIGVSTILITLLLIFAFIQFNNSRFRAKMNKLLQKKNVELQESNNQIKTALNTKNQFLDTITHELRTPLNSIKGASYLLSKEKDATKSKVLTDTLSFSSDYLLSLIDNVIEINILDKNKEIVINNSVIDLNNLIVNCINSVQVKKNNNVEILSEVDSSIPNKVMGDSFRLSQVLINLIENAVKFTKDGEVKVKVTKIFQNKSNIRLQFEISDTGIGIEQKELKRITEPFKHANKEIKETYGGLGLGLSVAFKILEAFNAKPKVESELNKGTIVSFELDFLSKIEVEEVVNIEGFEEFVDTSKIKILLVEDNKINQAITQKILQSKGFKCEVANNGLEAYNMVVENDYSLILMDIMMPVMDGFEASKKINEIKPTIPIIALTAVYEEVNKDKFEKAKIKEVLNKPVKIDLLYKSVLNNININNL